MSIQEIKEQVVTLPHDEQGELIAFLFHLRQGNQADYISSVSRRSQDADLTHWIPPDEFESQLDRKAPR